MNVYELFAGVSATAADRPALIGGMGRRRRVVTFDTLHRRVDGIVEQLSDQGLEAGDRVLVAVPPSIDTYAVMLAVLKAGMVVVFIDPAHSASRVSQILKAWPPAAVIATRTILLLRVLMPELRRIDRTFCVDGGATGAIVLDPAASASVPTTSCNCQAADSALLSFTSGSTSAPKPVIRTHGFLRQQMKILERIADVQPADIDYVTMPMFVLFNLANGITSVIPACDMKQPGKADPAIVLEQLRTEKATRLIASPALLERLVACSMRSHVRLPMLRRMSTGGGPVSPSLPRKLAVIAPHASLRMVYGSTEAEPIAVVDAETISVADRAGMRRGHGLLVGRPVEGCDVRILATRPGVPVRSLTAREFDALGCPGSEIGEIVVAGRHVLTAYADSSRNPETKIDVDGTIWHRTGDAGYLDGTGRLWLVGRLSAGINDEHGTVYPFQVEYAVQAAAAVARAALIQLNGRRTLVVEGSRQLLEERCAAFAPCIDHFHIASVRSLRHIPMDRRHNAKIDYPALRGRLDGRLNALRIGVIESLSGVFRLCRRWACSACHAGGRHLAAVRSPATAADHAKVQRTPKSASWSRTIETADREGVQ